MAFSSTSVAAGKFYGIKNVPQSIDASVLPRKILLCGTYNPALTVTDHIAVQITSEADAGNKYGYGFELHRLARASFKGSQGVETWALPMPETGGAAQATGTITLGAGPATANGTLHLYIAGEYVPVVVSVGDTVTNIGDAIDTAVASGAYSFLPVTSNNVAGVVTFTAKSGTPYGDEIGISLNLLDGQETPTGITTAIVAMSGGAGVPVIATALNGLGTGDAANANNFTDFSHANGIDQTSLTSISTYNGLGNDFLGCYAKEVARPFRALTGHNEAGAAGLATLVALAGNNLLDRTNGVLAVPGSPNPASECAAQATGIMARLNNNRAEESYEGQILEGVFQGATSTDRWTDDYDSRNTAALIGISATHYEENVIKLQDVLTMYHPASVDITNNGYRDMRNISINQNILQSMKNNFNREKWTGISIVADVTKVTDATSKAKARDLDSVLDDLVALANEWAGHAWLYSASYTINRLTSDASLVTIRAGGRGFDIVMPVVYSGIGTIVNTEVQYDTSLSVFF